eukprot:scaffold310407_cov17-Tisochrysis_lutea.AAC.1
MIKGMGRRVCLVCTCTICVESELSTLEGARGTIANPGESYVLVVTLGNDCADAKYCMQRLNPHAGIKLWGGLGLGGHAAAVCSSKQQRKHRGVLASRGL